MSERSDCAGRIPLLRSSSGSGRFCLEVFIARKAGYLPQRQPATATFAEIRSVSWNSRTQFMKGVEVKRELCTDVCFIGSRIQFASPPGLSVLPPPVLISRARSLRTQRQEVLCPADWL